MAPRQSILGPPQNTLKKPSDSGTHGLKKMPYVTKKRPYDKEYAEYHSTEEQKKNRAKRNAARRQKIREGSAKKGDGMDVDHVTPLSKGGSNAKSNLRMKTASSNRSKKNK